VKRKYGNTREERQNKELIEKGEDRKIKMRIHEIIPRMNPQLPVLECHHYFLALVFSLVKSIYPYFCLYTMRQNGK
jgi:hypothetical protein